MAARRVHVAWVVRQTPLPRLLSTVSDWSSTRKVRLAGSDAAVRAGIGRASHSNAMAKPIIVPKGKWMRRVFIFPHSNNPRRALPRQQRQEQITAQAGQRRPVHDGGAGRGAQVA